MAQSQESLHFLDYWRVISSRKEIVIAVSLLVVLTGIAVTYSMPKVYMGSTLIQVRKEAPDVEIFSRQSLPYDPYFLRTQFEIIQSDPVIEETVKDLKLDQALAEAYGYVAEGAEQIFKRAVTHIGSRMRVQQYRDTNLIEIQMYMSEPKERVRETVAEVANTIAEVYRRLNMGRSREATTRALDALQQSLQDQRKAVADSEKRLEEIQKKYAIAIVSSRREVGSLEKISLAALEQNLINVHLAFEEKKARYETLMKMSPDELRDVAPYLVGDRELAALVAERRRAEVERSALARAALGPKHPDMVAAEARVADLKAMIRDAVEGLKKGVQADYEAAQAKIKALEKTLESRKRKDIDAESAGGREYDRALEELQREKRIRDALEMRLVQERIEQRIPRTTVEVIEKAKPPPEGGHVRPNFILNLLLSVFLGVGAGIGLAYFIEYLDTSVKTIEEIESHLGLPVVGVVPQKVRPLNEELADPAHGEAYRLLRTNLQFSAKLAQGKTVSITSGSVGEGKSLTLFNLAYINASMGEKTLIVDSDLHRPRQHRILGLSNASGLVNILAGEAGFEDVAVVTDIPNLHFLPSGRMRSGVHGLLDSDRMNELIDVLKENYDRVFFDSPPVIGVSDASQIARHMDGVLLVVQHRKYPRAVSLRARDMLQNMGANVVGVVLNNINISRDYSSYYYQQHYYYYPRRSKRAREEEA